MKNTVNTPELQEQINLFFEYVSPARLSRNLRNLLLSYLALQKDAHNFELEDLLLDLQALFNLLDAAEKRRIKKAQKIFRALVSIVSGCYSMMKVFTTWLVVSASSSLK